jgi:pyridoxal phosphate enzyme (YggS family)
MTGIVANLKKLKNQLPSTVKLVAVSKTRTVSEILEAYNAGQRLFGENRVQEILNKKDLLPPDIEWHLIGHLQSNKVKYIVPYVSMVESVDSVKLLKLIDSESVKVGREVDCLLQVHIAEEETKFGFSTTEIIEFAKGGEFKNLKGVRLSGLMGMATFTEDKALVRKEFSELADCFRHLKSHFFADNINFREISMGMSGDYPTAIAAGSTIVRIGSLIFGERNISK